MKVIRKVAIKQEVTENSKEKLKKDYEWKIFQYEQECEQLVFEQKKLEQQQTVQKKEDIAARFKKEIDSRKDHINWYKYKLEQLDLLPIGNQIHDGEIDAIVEVEEGMNWEEMQKNASIVIRDGIVVNITE
ncbi:hypothetical protein J416_00919 [Gracilibacillus halophilus YIM-C55.5]|uniref:YlqD protein n=1 Tax=Gracilibacillus halophilus YIM-C55.5 TaxID=1308866 RepID=N4WD92_9BACI|nr:YlqD family protein [Gracilibacillus halophilus]ENH98263.1 hypothetical protein J416_00919 [Gracilibacillus halophilus YIM-C55.5]